MFHETIFALASAWGKAGIAVIRISGTHARLSLEHLGVKKELLPRTATLVKLYDSKNICIDNALAIYFPAPHSFTGESVVELHIHGSIAVIKLILEELGIIFQPAQRGEFTQRAFYNNKLDLTEVEGLADLIAAETSMQARQAMRQMNGEIATIYKQWRQSLLEIIVHVEAYIDFFTEDLCAQMLIEINEKVCTLITQIRGHLQDDIGERIRSGLNIAIIGPPNAGKSTLFNYLAKKEMAIVSPYRGTTRDTLQLSLDIAGYAATLYDTAGIHTSNDLLESEGIKRAQKCARSAEIKIALFSIDELHILNSDLLSILDKNTLCFASKADHLNQEVVLFARNITLIPLSIHANVNINTLLDKLTCKVKEFFTHNKAPVITQMRHRTSLQQCLQHLEQFNIDKSLELAAEDLHLAAQNLGEITGEIKVETILNELFKKFCVGK